MKIHKLSFSFVLYLALIEGISLFVLDFSKTLQFYNWFLVGFIPALVVLLLYKLTFCVLPVKVNNEKVSRFPVILPSVANGLFIMLLFLIQDLIVNINAHKFIPFFGFISVLLAFLVLVFIYNSLNLNCSKINLLKIKFYLNNKHIEVKKVNLMFAVYAGIFEFFILPLMTLFYSTNVPVLLNGFVSGLVGGLLGLFIVNRIVLSYPLETEAKTI